MDPAEWLVAGFLRAAYTVGVVLVTLAVALRRLTHGKALRSTDSRTSSTSGTE